VREVLEFDMLSHRKDEVDRIMSDDKFDSMEIINRERKQEIMKRQSAHDYVFCPECGTKVVHENGCVTCPACGWSLCG